MSSGRTLALLFALTLSACAGRVPEPKIVLQRVEVPISAPCVPAKLGEKPTYSDSIEALRNAADAAIRYQLLWAGRSEREARLDELEGVVQGCLKVTG